MPGLSGASSTSRHENASTCLRRLTKVWRLGDVIGGAQGGSETWSDQGGAGTCGIPVLSREVSPRAVGGWYYERAALTQGQAIKELKMPRTTILDAVVQALPRDSVPRSATEIHKL